MTDNELEFICLQKAKDEIFTPNIIEEFKKAVKC